ncbi:MAG: glycerate kinase, partial [Actinobacteria bacterium]|nr:glycerate kinase [Actinomycetota bacterium]
MRSPKIIVAPDSFKGTLSALAAAEAIGAGWSAARPDDNVMLLPQADGGEGSLDAIERAVAGQGTRMKSATPKLLHKLAGVTVVSH